MEHESYGERIEKQPEIHRYLSVTTGAMAPTTTGNQVIRDTMHSRFLFLSEGFGVRTKENSD